MKIFIEKNQTTKDIKFKGTVIELLKKLKINPEEVIVAKNTDIVSSDEKITDKDEIKILSVISGG